MSVLAGLVTTIGHAVSYEILTFHAENPSGHFHVEGDLRAPAMLNILLRSARRFDPSVSLTLLTTPGTNLFGTIVDFNRVDQTIDHGSLMLERMRAQAAYIARALGPRPMALLDSDIIVNTDLAPLFRSDFDIGLTWRPSKRGMPFNGGVLLVNNRRPQASRQFFRALLAAYEENFRESALWYGDQFALAKVVGLNAAQLEKTSAAEIAGIRYAFLPCATYNHAPDWRARSLMLEDVSGKILHFKERSRRLMEPFWRYRIAEPPGRSTAALQDLAVETFRLARHSRAYREAWEKDGRRALKRGRPSLAAALTRRLSWGYRAAPK